MSISLLTLQEKKDWLNGRVNNLIVDGNLTVSGSVTENINVGNPIAPIDNNGMVSSSGTTKLEFADSTHNGILSATTQTIGGNKEFTGNVQVDQQLTVNSASNQIVTNNGTLNFSSTSGQIFTIPSLSTSSNFLLDNYNNTINGQFNRWSNNDGRMTFGTSTSNTNKLYTLFGSQYASGSYVMMLTNGTSTTNLLTLGGGGGFNAATNVNIYATSSVNSVGNIIVEMTSSNVKLDSVNLTMNGGQITSTGGNLVLNSSTSDIVFNKGIKLPTSGGTASNINFYQETITNFTFSGAVSTIAANVTIQKLNNIVTINVGALLSTYSTTGPIMSTTAIPTPYIPVIEQDFPVQVQNNGVLGLGCITISNTGIISIYNNINTSSGNFTAGTCGLAHGASFSYDPQIS